ncbi:pilus assembly protein PilP [Salinisphaera sp. Q1T1-3]|uniref:pilus assembly protein PilP n=1 Tax=Salinisphaera sp. Q1T1-3 TaxID=2321229 RepID=UPI000E723868|nr:pilus assembly protein PilP [Salinisphaera sp. Q1T1-3]RJS94301.1 hypothetical protein D3260_04110 [Salinisphaera sp. Q1T1-3]
MSAAALSRACLIATVIGALAGCGDSNHTDLETYVARIKARKSPPLDPMPDIVEYKPYTYVPAGRRSPFAPPEPVRQTRSSQIHPDLDRPLDPLEQFPLDALSLVGTIAVNGTTYALIQAPDGVVHRVGPGTHIGRNYGQINHIDRRGVALTEIVADGNGGYIKRHAQLTPPNDSTP